MILFKHKYKRNKNNINLLIIIYMMKNNSINFQKLIGNKLFLKIKKFRIIL